MLLEDKVVVVYGAGGAIGGAFARVAEREGARVFATGRTAAPGIEPVDALSPSEVAGHMSSVIERAGRVDVSFNAIGLPDDDTIGIPLLDLSPDAFVRPVRDYALSYFLTAQAAARHMVTAGRGVIMTVTALPARSGSRLIGGYGPGSAAKEALTRGLSVELAPAGVRVVGVRPHGIPEAASMKHVWELKGAGMSWDDFQAYLAGSTHPKRVMTLSEVAEVAVFMASDRASGMTGSTVNLTMGSLDD